MSIQTLYLLPDEHSTDSRGALRAPGSETARLAAECLVAALEGVLLLTAELFCIGSRHRAPRGSGRQARPAASRRQPPGQPPPPTPRNQPNKAATEAGGAVWSRGWDFRLPRQSNPRTGPFASCVAVGFDVVQDEDGLHDRGRAAWTTAQLGQDFPGLEHSDGAFAAARTFACARLTAFCRRDSFSRKRRRLNGVRTLPRAP